MMELVFKIWFMAAILPFIIFLEGDKRLAEFLKKKNIYAHWDVWHSSIVVLFILWFILWMKGF